MGAKVIAMYNNQAAYICD